MSAEPGRLSSEECSTVGALGGVGGSGLAADEAGAGEGGGDGGGGAGDAGGGRGGGVPASFNDQPQSWMTKNKGL